MAKKRAKERKKQKVITQQKQKLASNTGKIELASRGPFRNCAVWNVQEGGSIDVFVARQIPRGQIVVVNWLLDPWCLGVRACNAKAIEWENYTHMLKMMEEKTNHEPVPPGIALGIVEKVCAYGMSLGFSPPANYQAAMLIWGSTVAENVDDLIKCGGPAGKPRYVSMPDITSPERHIAIVQNLSSRFAPDEFEISSTYDLADDFKSMWEEQKEYVLNELGFVPELIDESEEDDVENDSEVEDDYDD